MGVASGKGYIVQNVKVIRWILEAFHKEQNVL